MTITQNDNDFVSGVWSRFSEHKQPTIDEKTRLSEIATKLWEVHKNYKLDYDVRVKNFEFIKLVHLILGRKFDENWKPKPKGQRKIITVEDRSKNVLAFKKWIDDHTGDNFKPDDNTTILAFAHVWGATS